MLLAGIQKQAGWMPTFAGMTGGNRTLIYLLLYLEKQHPKVGHTLLADH